MSKAQEEEQKEFITPEQKTIRCDICVQKIKDRINKYGYQTQYEALLKEGFADEKMIEKALLKQKGDMLLAIEYLNKSPKKRISTHRSHQKQYGEEKQIEIRKCKCKGYELSRQDKNDRKLMLLEEKYKKMVERNANYIDFKTKIRQGSIQNDSKIDSKDNSKAKQGDDQSSLKNQNLKIDKSMDLLQNIEKGQFLKLILDGSNCFYVDPNFVESAVINNFRDIEEKIVTIMKLFQSAYNPLLDITIVFNSSSLVQDEKECSQYIKQNFKILSAKPQFESSEDLIISLGSSEKNDSQEVVLYVTGDRQLQAHLKADNAKHIISSKNFFSILKESYIDKRTYSAIVEQ